MVGEKYKYDWPALKAEYVTGNISVRRMAENHGIPLPTIEQRATKERWKKAKQKHRDKVVEKASEKIASAAVRKLEKELDIADKLADVIRAALGEDLQFRRYIVTETDIDCEGNKSICAREREFDRVDMKAVGDAVKALAGVVDIKRVIGGILTEAERRKLELDERRLAMDERKSGTGGDDEGRTGVVFLAPVMPEPEEGGGDDG